jgi:hypothetical protein
MIAIAGNFCDRLIGSAGLAASIIFRIQRNTQVALSLDSSGNKIS